MPDALVKKAADADPDPPVKNGAATHNPAHVKSLLDGLKGLLGIKETPVMGQLNPTHDPNKAAALEEAGIGGALNRGIADGTDASGH